MTSGYALPPVATPKEGAARGVRYHGKVGQGPLSDVAATRVESPPDSQILEESAVTLMQLVGLLRKNWMLLLASAMVGILLGAGVSWFQPTLYSATSTGYVVAGNSSTVGDAFAGKNLAAEKAASYLPLVQSRSVAERVAEDLSLDSTGPVIGTLQGSNEGVIFRIKATASSPEFAAQLADAAIRATAIEANALETLTVTGENTGYTVVTIVPVELAQTPTSPVSPNWKRNMLIGLALGLMAGFGVVVARQSLDRRIREAADAEAVAGAAALGIIPSSDELVGTVSLATNMGAAAEALRQLRTNLRFVSVDDPARCIVVTSSMEGEGKSTIATHLASMLAESGQPTILVDADLRRPVQADHFSVDGVAGLTQVLAGSLELEHALVQTANNNLLLLPAGRIPPNPSELVGSGRMQTLLAQLKKTHLVIVDAPPLLAVTDAVLLTTAADGAILVVQQGKTRIEQVGLASRKLEQVEGTLLGVVLNQVPKKDLQAATYGYGYGSYPGYTSQYHKPGQPGDAERPGRQEPRHPRRAKQSAAEPAGAAESQDSTVREPASAAALIRNGTYLSS